MPIRKVAADQAAGLLRPANDDEGGAPMHDHGALEVWDSDVRRVREAHGTTTA